MLTLEAAHQLNTQQRAIAYMRLLDIHDRLLASFKTDAECRLLVFCKDLDAPEDLRLIAQRAVNWLTTLHDERRCLQMLREAVGK